MNLPPGTDLPVLEMRGISKSFPGVKALTEVDLTVRKGEVHALMGENGAGKSTLIKVLTGVYPRDAGEIRLGGRAVEFHSPLQAQASGVSTVYQEVNLVPFLSVAENICLGRQPGRFGMIRWKEVRSRAEGALRKLGLSLDVTRPLNSYSIAIQQLVAIARALGVAAELLILDEPTSSLDAAEVAQLFTVLRKLKEEGLSIIFVTHFLDQVYAIADRITVLRNGQLVGEFASRQLPRLELVAKMLGKNVADLPAAPAAADRPPSRTEGAPPFLEARGLSRRHAIAPFDLSLRPAEKVGLAGLLGSGRTEMARLLFGIDRADTGAVRVDGKPVALTSPRRAIRLGIGFCPEDRKVEGIVPNLSVRANIILALQARQGWLGALSVKEQTELADHYIRALNIATPDAEKPIKLLSGGNQQKAILARWLAAHPRLLILDEPTRGIDVGAKFEIEKLMNRLAEDGLSILFISSELDEVVRNCQRVVVLRDRAKIAELTGAEISEPAVMSAIAAAPSKETRLEEGHAA